MTPETIFKTMQDLIAEQFAIDADEVTMDSSFVDDLGADSVDLVELVMAMEEEFDIGEIDEEDLHLSRLWAIASAISATTLSEILVQKRKPHFRPTDIRNIRFLPVPVR